MSHDGKQLHFRKSIEVDPIFYGVKQQSQIVNPTRNKHGKLYVGSVDILTAQNWAKECGAKLGTKEWAAYARKKLATREFSNYRATHDRVMYNGHELPRV